MKNKIAFLLFVLYLGISLPLAFAQDESVTLRLAVADEQGRPSEPYVLEFINQVKTLSDGNIIIEPVWQAGDETFAGFETGVIQLVNKGEYALGLAGARAWDTESYTNFQVLQAPFLITNDALAEAVATSDVATQLLASLSSVGFVGLTLWPEDLRHPFSLLPDKPLLAPEDFAGLNVRATPSFVTYMLMDTLRAVPMLDDSGYQGAESGLRQGASLTGTPTATGNVVFFPKYQVLFANGDAFENLSEEQQTMIRNAAAAMQEKAIVEHPREADAAAAWCADGGTIVLASEEQVAAFEEAAQPVFEQIEQDPVNAELIAAIRDLKANTEPSPGAEACGSAVTKPNPTPSADTQVWSAGLPPNGVWQKEPPTDDLVGVAMRSVPDEWVGLYTLTYQDGTARFDWQGNQGQIGKCVFTYAEVEDFIRFTSIDEVAECPNEIDDMQWRLDADGNLHLNIINDQNAGLTEAKAMYEGKPWKKVD